MRSRTSSDRIAIRCASANRPGCHSGFTFESWAVLDGEFPPSVTACDGWLITGSGHGAYDPLPWMRLYGFAEAIADVGPDLDHAHAIGPGARLGALLGTRDTPVALDVSARTAFYLLGDATEHLAVGAEARIALGRSWALGFGLDAVRVYDENRLDAYGALHFFP